MILPYEDQTSSVFGIIYDRRIQWTVMLGWGVLGIEVVIRAWEFVRNIREIDVVRWVARMLPRHVPV